MWGVLLDKIKRGKLVFVILFIVLVVVGIVFLLILMLICKYKMRGDIYWELIFVRN